MQKATKVTVAATIASKSSNFAEKSRPAKTSRFLTHSCGRRATITARSGPRRGFGGQAAGGYLGHLRLRPLPGQGPAMDREG